MENQFAKNRGTTYTNTCSWAVYRPGMLKVASKKSYGNALLPSNLVKEAPDFQFMDTNENYSNWRKKMTRKLCVLPTK